MHKYFEGVGSSFSLFLFFSIFFSTFFIAILFTIYILALAAPNWALADVAISSPSNISIPYFLETNLGLFKYCIGSICGLSHYIKK